MKKFLYILLLTLTSMGVVTSCDLETDSTTAVSGEELFSDATKALIPLNGIYRSMYNVGWSTTGNYHQCFGPAAYALTADVMGEDMIMSGQGSGWFWYDCIYNVKSRYTSSTWRSYDIWFAHFIWIANANYIIAAEETMSGAPDDVAYVVGQAYALRAYSYYYLAQFFSRTYKGHESEPCVPLYVEPTTAATEGQPRSTVQEVYDQALADINTAITLLDGSYKQLNKSHIDARVARGFKSRICLTMEKWEDAAKAAKEAREGYTIGGENELLAGMNDLTKGNVMWGAGIIADQSGMFAGLFTHMDHTAGAYGNTARKLINKKLYDKMAISDLRRGWWDPSNSVPYTQVKFRFSDIATWMGDYIYMRAEEMLLTEAEARCRMGDEAGAIALLKELMAKRDPEYTTAKTGTSLGALTTDETGSLLEEILIQRRIELWGEYGRIFDIRRLKQGFKRTADMGWPISALIEGRDTQNPESYAWVLTIPQAEFDGNENMDATQDQNPVGDTK